MLRRSRRLAGRLALASALLPVSMSALASSGWAGDGLGRIETQASPADVPTWPVDLTAMLVVDALTMLVAP
jgi:hypothetical protein